MRYVKQIVSVAFVVVAGSISSHGQTILNGSFELPSLPPNTSEVGTAGADWTVSGTVDAVDLNSNNANLNGNTTFGSQYLQLFGPEGTDAPAVVSQVVTNFVAGQTYSLNVDLASLTVNPATLTLEISGDVFFGATLSKSFTVLGGGPYGSGDIPFQTATLTFIPFASGSATVGLESSLGGDEVAIDNVVLNDPDVPEPSAASELALGLGALAGLYALRRRRA